jgi:hypothetical protein
MYFLGTTLHEQALRGGLRLSDEFPLPLRPAGWQPQGRLKPRGDFNMLLTRRIDVLAIFAAFAFVGAILLGMF